MGANPLDKLELFGHFFASQMSGVQGGRLGRGFPAEAVMTKSRVTSSSRLRKGGVVFHSILPGMLDTPREVDPSPRSHIMIVIIIATIVLSSASTLASAPCLISGTFEPPMLNPTPAGGRGLASHPRPALPVGPFRLRRLIACGTPNHGPGALIPLASLCGPGGGPTGKADLSNAPDVRWAWGVGAEYCRGRRQTRLGTECQGKAAIAGTEPGSFCLYLRCSLLGEGTEGKNEMTGSYWKVGPNLSKLLYYLVFRP